MEYISPDIDDGDMRESASIAREGIADLSFSGWCLNALWSNLVCFEQIGGEIGNQNRVPRKD